MYICVKVRERLDLETKMILVICTVTDCGLLFSVMNNYQAAAAAAAQGFGPPASPHASGRGAFPAANSPGPIDMYSSSAAESVAGYVQAASPQPSGFPAIAVSRAPINYSPVSRTHAAYLMP